MTADAADEDDDAVERRRLPRRWRVALVLGIVLLLALLVAWSQRRPIAQNFVDRELTRRGVPARYTVADIGFSSQRLTNVVLGDPANPDLVADWVEVHTDIGLGGASVTGLAAGKVRARGRIVDGRLSFGSIDRLLPAPSGKPFALPAIDANLQDVRLRIAAPQGIVGVKLSGSGRLNDGFSGRLAAVGERLDGSGCTAQALGAALAIRVSGGRPSIEGPARIATLDCGSAHVAGLAADVAATLSEALDRWTGRARIAAGEAKGPGIAAEQLLARVTFDGTARSTAGDVAVKAASLRGAPASVGGAAIEGRYRAGTAGLEFAGRARADRVVLPRQTLRAAAALGDSVRGTPIAPLAGAIAAAAVRAGSDFAIDGAVEAVMRGGASAIRVTSLDATARSGARASIGGAPLRFGAVELGGRMTLGGGGLPEAVVALNRTPGGIAGRAVVQPYAADGARLALTPITFAAQGKAITRVTTTATLSGPLGDGRVEGLSLPIDARWRGTRLAVNTACAPLVWQRLATAGLVLNPARLTLCPSGGALVTLDGGRLGGGARISATRLTGTLGGTPLTLAATGGELMLGDTGFMLRGIAARLGSADRVTRIDAGRVDGRIAGGVVRGKFAGASGQIGKVPLLLSDAAGDWSLRGGVLALAGTLKVADAASEPRFKPLAGNGVTLKLADGRVTAAGTLVAPGTGAKVADVAIDHVLKTGGGHASLIVPGIVFAENGLQPDDLTPITYGVIAAVSGGVAGRGDIAWNRDGVTSSGRFATDRLDLAAAFGPVTGIKGEIVFTDLLGLVTAPGQVATIATINPGIAVENGTVRYQLTGNSRVQVESGRWPFAGGELALDPTLLDFDAAQQRRMTFRVTRADAAAFLQQFDFDNLAATGTFDGVLPMIFDQSGGRIEDGRLAARGGGSIAYVGTVTEKNVGFWGNLAFQALKALNYRKLDITMNGPLAGEMVTAIRFAGVSQGAGTKSNFLIRRLAKLPFVFNVTVRGPFR